MTVALAAVLALVAARPCAAAVPNPKPVDLGVLTNCDSSQAYAINASGQVVGESWNSADWSVDLPFIVDAAVKIPFCAVLKRALFGHGQEE